MEAEQLLQRALQGKERIFGTEHSSTLEAIRDLGVWYENQGRLVEAEQQYRLALNGYEKAFGPEHSSTLHMVRNLGILYANQGRLVQAEQQYQRAFNGYKKAFGPEHPKCQELLQDISDVQSGPSDQIDELPDGETMTPQQQEHTQGQEELVPARVQTGNEKEHPFSRFLKHWRKQSSRIS